MLDYKGNNSNTNDDPKDVTYRSTNRSIQYCIMRVGKKYYNMKSIEAFEYHMEREGQIENADSTKSYENRILIGDANVYENLNQHIKGVQTRKDSCIARDMILTASPDFFRGLSKGDFERWLNLNVEWLKKTYGDNCIYAVLHLDETSPHLHILLSVDYINTKGKRVMSNNHYFGGKMALSDLQTNYSKHIQSTFKSLNRGLKGSKANHISIKQFYNIVNKSLDEKDINSITAKAKNSELMEVKLNDIKKTLTAYKDYQLTESQEKEKLKQQNAQLFQNLAAIKKDDQVFKESMKAISNLYKIPQEDLIKIIEYCEEKVNGKELEK